MQELPEPIPNAAPRAGTGAWIVAAALLLAFAPRLWQREGTPGWFGLAQTPLDRVSPAAAAQWTFLSDALRTLPREATYTIFAPTPEEEMNLFMMSLGLYAERGNRPLPSSYFGVDFPGRGSGADYALDYGCRRTDSAAFNLVARVRGGCVERSRISTEKGRAARQ